MAIESDIIDKMIIDCLTNWWGVISGGPYDDIACVCVTMTNIHISVHPLYEKENPAHCNL